MKNQLKNIRAKQDGFTIIEVMIVLVIAAVILLIVFLAVPALQRNSRNTQRNNDASRIASLVNECINNRNGTVTSCDDATEINFNAADFGQLINTPVFVTGGSTAPASSTTGAGVWLGAKCNADSSGGTTTGASTRQAAVVYTLEPTVTKCVSL